MLDFTEVNGGTFEQAAKARQVASGAHNKRETPNFAASIVRTARATSAAGNRGQALRPTAG